MNEIIRKSKSVSVRTNIFNMSNPRKKQKGTAGQAVDVTCAEETATQGPVFGELAFFTHFSSTRCRADTTSREPVRLAGEVLHGFRDILAAVESLPDLICATGLFPSSKPTAATPFTLYASTSSGTAGPIALAAETSTMEWESRNHMGVETNGVGEVSGEGAGYSTQ